MHPSPANFAVAEARASILLVDDEPSNLLALEAVLEDLGQPLIRAGSGEEALERLTHEDFAVILLDVRMTGLDGYQTAVRIRAREHSKVTPIIFLSAYADERVTVEKAYALGAIDFLIKPLVPVILRAKVMGFVDLHQKTLQIQRQAEQLRRHEKLIFEERLAQENARLRESEQFHRVISELTSDFACAGRMDPDQGVVLETVTDGFRKVTGYTLEELNAQGGWASILYSQDMPKVSEALQRLSNGEVAKNEIRFIAKNGTLRWMRFLSYPVWNADHSRVVRVYSAVEDITDRKLAEEALQKADRHKDEFLAMLAHELRNPLAPIRNALHILKQPGVNRSIRQQARDIAERQVLHMARLLDDLLDVSRISHGRIELRPDWIQVAALVQHTVDALKPQIDEQRHQLNVSVQPPSLRMYGDSARLEQILSNLLTNACKYTDPGGRISVQIAQEDGEVVWRVKDTGIGIPADMLPHIFDLFVQAERRLDRSQGGVGIGLTLVRRLAELHGGSIQVFSAGPGRGSEFVVHFPHRAMAAAASN
jgi:PAS domain S-box-containing protein